MNDFERELHNILTTMDGRCFIYDLLLHCGIDMLSGIPTNKVDDFVLGQRKIGIDIFNKIYYNEGDRFREIISEQTRLSKTKKGELDD